MRHYITEYGDIYEYVLAESESHAVDITLEHWRGISGDDELPDAKDVYVREMYEDEHQDGEGVYLTAGSQ